MKNTAAPWTLLPMLVMLQGGVGALAAEADWRGYGGDATETHFSSLRQIAPQTLERLKLAWYFDVDTSRRADSQPVEAGGVVFIATGLSVVQALDGRSGRVLWRYDPDVGDVAGAKLRSSWGIRGLAYSGGRVFMGTEDGRLIALDAAHGTILWSVQTLPQDDDSGITGAPRVFEGRVIIGSTGGERSLHRGQVSCFNAADGKFLWRFNTIPGDPQAGFESDAMRRAAKTWSGDWWKNSGGGMVWNAITYDAELHRIYIGVGNAGPWNWKIRHPGDNLFTASIVALDAATGRYVWHYQETPNDAWDYDAATDMALATLRVDGRSRRVILQSSKNGFFYVLDRDTGKLLAADKDEKASWAEGVDMRTGRPVEVPGARYEDKSVVVWPGDLGAHNWQPMAFSPLTGLAYVPTLHRAMRYDPTGTDAAHWQPAKNQWNFGLGVAPPDAAFSNALLAWDPVARKPAWRVTLPGHFAGGAMAAAGGLVFQGHVDGNFVAYDARNGRDLWSFPAGVAVMGAPASYSVDGRQYIVVMSGPPSGAAADSDGPVWRYGESPKRLLAFALDGTAHLPPSPAPGLPTPLRDTSLKPDAGAEAVGAALYGAHCVVCHGPNVVAGGAAPDLRASPIALSAASFAQVVQTGTMVRSGMPQFAEFSNADLAALRQYIRSRASAPVATSGSAHGVSAPAAAVKPN